MRNKILYALIAITVLSSNVQAQVEKGDKALGANFALNNTTIEDVTITLTTLILSYEQYVTDNVSVGVAPQIVGIFSDEFDAGNVGLNFFGSYAFLLDDANVLPYVGANYTFLATIDSESDEPPSFGNFGVYGGGKFFLSEQISIDARLSYSRYIHSSLGEVPDGGLLSLTIGVNVLLPKK